MKFPVFLWLMLFALGCGLMALGFFSFRDAFLPPPIRFEAVAVEDVTPYTATVSAVVDRETVHPGCTNGIQADLRTGGVVTRLPVPLRAQVGDRSEYALVLPLLAPGAYDLQVRETFLCPDRFRVVGTPWMRMEVENVGVA